jgi:formate hydrogenlyase subunit 6/NADH:ubiquinone oxidoreductase subunit I
MCAYFCPTGALSKFTQDDQPGVSFRLAACTNCGLCREVCYRDAVVSSSTVHLDRVLDPVDELLCLRQGDDAAGQQASQERIHQHIIETLGR